MATRAKLQQELTKLQDIVDGVKQALGTDESKEILGDIKEALKEAGFELPENDDELAAAISEYDFSGEEGDEEN